MTLTEFTEFVMQFLSLSLYMGIVILLVRGSTQLFGRKIRAGTRYFLWILLLARLLVPVLPSVPAAVEIPVGDVERFYHVVYGEEEGFPIQVMPESEYRMEYAIPEMISPAAPPEADAVPRKNISVDLVLLIPVLWLTGAAVYLFWNLGGYLFMMLRFRCSFVPASTEQNAMANKLAGIRGIRRVPPVYISSAVRSPMLCGFFRPVIVLPSLSLSENETAGVLAHELIHYKRGDLWIQLFGLLVCAMHWFNPAVHLADRWMREEMELSCDEAVLAGQGEDVRSVYGNGMLTILRQCRKRSVPMTTHFSPRLRMMQARFENIMDTRQKKRGVLWIAVVLVLCVLAGSAVACVQGKVVETVSPTNLDFANVVYDESGNLQQIFFTDKGRFYSIEHTDEYYPWIDEKTSYIPVFANGSLPADCDGMPALPARVTEDGTYLVDVMAILLTLYPDAGYSLEGSPGFTEGETWSAGMDYRIDGRNHEVIFRSPEKRVLLDKKEQPVSFTLEMWKDLPVGYTDGPSWYIWVTPEDAALLLGAECAFYNAGPTSIIGEDGKPHLYYPFGEPFYLANRPHLAFWRYPESASVIPEEEALEKLETQLIRAYENTYGTFVPLEEEPASSPYPGDDVMFRWKIAHLEAASETDRFYRIPFVWDFLVDKYTGEVIVHYNGESQTFHRFNPESTGALAFAG